MLSTLFLLISASWATGLHSEEVSCPIGEDVAKQFFVLSSNEYGGFDSDGATYSSGMQFRNYEIVTCSQNFYTALGADMEKTWSSEEAKTILAIIEKTRTSFQNPKLPETWERYELAIEIYRWQGKPYPFLIELYQKATWSIRDEAVGIHEGLAGPTVADQVLKLGSKELEKTLSSEQRKMVLFNLARVAHRNARFEQRTQFISAFMALPDLSSMEKKTGARFKELTEVIEPEYLKKTKIEIEKYLQDNPNDGQMLYILGDIYRRLDDMDSCTKYFNAANLTNDLQEEQRQIMQYLLKG